jgi:AraC-like DNA-binding protein
VFDCKKDQTVKYMFEKLGRLCESEDAIPTEKKAVVFEILSLLGAPDRMSTGSTIIKKGVAYLKLHYNENPSVKKLAQMCAISEEYFRRLFKKEFEMNPCEYRNRLRLSKACDYLTYGEMSVEEISRLLGYSTASHFSKEFKSAYGVSPLKYREMR